MFKLSFSIKVIYIILALFLAAISLITYHREVVAQTWRENVQRLLSDSKGGETPTELNKLVHPSWTHKPGATGVADSTPIVDNFLSAQTSLPSIPAWNTPPITHVTEKTPLLIGFTRNWRILQQAVVSYITAGWPAKDIYVIENTGVMDNNKYNRLHLQNPFFLNYTRLEQLGVNVIRTPTLLNFAQLQNFYINFAVEKELKGYFWSHMDLIVLSDETQERSVYRRALDIYRERFSSNMHEKWAAVWFSYDRLVLVNTAAYLDLGGWDTFIGYYMTDCDFHERVMMKGWVFSEINIGLIYDVGTSLDDLSILYRQGAQRNDQSYHDLISRCDQITRVKGEDKRGRNFWQGRQHGGIGDPFFRDSLGFEEAIQTSIQQGRDMFAEKWGHRDCELRANGLKLEDAWKVEKDW